MRFALSAAARHTQAERFQPGRCHLHHSHPWCCGSSARSRTTWLRLTEPFRFGPNPPLPPRLGERRGAHATLFAPTPEPTALRGCRRDNCCRRSRCGVACKWDVHAHLSVQPAYWGVTQDHAGSWQVEEDEDVRTAVGCSSLTQRPGLRRTTLAGIAKTLISSAASSPIRRGLTRVVGVCIAAARRRQGPDGGELRSAGQPAWRLNTSDSCLPVGQRHLRRTRL